MFLGIRVRLFFRHLFVSKTALMGNAKKTIHFFQKLPARLMTVIRETYLDRTCFLIVGTGYLNNSGIPLQNRMTKSRRVS